MDKVSPRFSTPSVDAAWVMPVGTGDLSAMVRYGKDLEIHLSKTDFYAREKKPYHKPLNIQSPGHVTLSFGINQRNVTGFEQKLDLKRGSVLLSIRTQDGEVKAEIFGVMGRNTLVVAVEDGRKPRTPTTAVLSIWRPEMELTATNGIIMGREVHQYEETGGIPKDPAVVNPSDAMYRLGCSPVVTFADEKGSIAAEAVPGVRYDEHSLTLKPSNLLPRSYQLLISVATTYDGHPEETSLKLLSAAAGKSEGDLLGEHLAWWNRFWQSSWIDMKGPDAARLLSLWYTGYYSYASVAGGPILPKFNGGPGLVVRDNRSWGWGYWWQNTRETIWPLLSADRINYARAALDFYDRIFSQEQAATVSKGKLGIRLGEAAQPFKPETPAPPKKPSVFDPAVLAKAMEDRTMEDCRSGYNARSLAQGSELVQLMFDYVAYSGDSDYLKSTVAPWLKEATLFWLSWLRKDKDGLYHSMFTDAAEMWWRIKDSAIDLSASRYCFRQTLLFGKEFGYEPAFLDAVKDRLDHLAPLPVGKVVRRPVKIASGDGQPEKTINGWDLDKTVDSYSPMGDFHDDRESHNAENPELYIVHPFAMVDANSPKAEYDRAVNTFRDRRCPTHAGWSQCAVEAARLRLVDSADVLLEHVSKHQTYPYGGWNSPAGILEGSLTGATDTPYFDAAGVFLTAFQESLLQSHRLTMDPKGDPLGIGPIVLVPSAGKQWTGRFRLLARGGFLVTAEFGEGRKPLSATVECRIGGTLRLANPYGECQVTAGGKSDTVRDPMIRLETKPGESVSFNWVKRI